MIPRVFHVYWDGPPLPVEYSGFIGRWTELHPGWEVLTWNDERYRQLFDHSRTMMYYDDPKRWSPRSNPWQWRADLARYEILHRMGGVWVDADLEPLRSIEPIVDEAERHANGGAFIAREDATWVGNALLGAAPGHPFLHDVLYLIDNRIRTYRHQRVNRSIGPHYLTGLVRRHPEVVILPHQLVYPFRYDQLHLRDEDFPAAFTKHHWHNSTVGSSSGRRPRR